MNTLAAVIALAAATALATPTLACGQLREPAEPTTPSASSPVPAEPVMRATGQWPSFVEHDGARSLELHYPWFEGSGRRAYVEWFEIVEDEQVAQLRHHLEWHGKSTVLVTVERTAEGVWRVVSFDDGPAP